MRVYAYMQVQTTHDTVGRSTRPILYIYVIVGFVCVCVCV